VEARDGVGLALKQRNIPTQLPGVISLPPKLSQKHETLQQSAVRRGEELRDSVGNVLAINARDPVFATRQVHERNRFSDGQLSWNLYIFASYYVTPEFVVSVCIFK